MDFIEEIEVGIKKQRHEGCYFEPGQIYKE
jgi:hypothetical protein